MYINKTKGDMLRSQATWCEEGEKSTIQSSPLEKETINTNVLIN